MRSAIAWLGKTKRLWALAAFLLVLFVLVRVTGLRDHMTLAFVHDQFEAHMVQGLLLFVLLFCLGNLVQIPGWIFLAAAVLALGKFWGGLATYVAAVTSCAFTFWVIRLLGGNALREFRGKWVLWALARLDARPVLSVAVLRCALHRTSNRQPWACRTNVRRSRQLRAWHDRSRFLVEPPVVMRAGLAQIATWCERLGVPSRLWIFYAT